MVETPKPRKPSPEEIARVAAARAVAGLPPDPVCSRQIAQQLGEAVSTPQRAETASIARRLGEDPAREGD